MADFQSIADEPRRAVMWEQERDPLENGGIVMVSLLLLILAIGAAYFLWEGHNAEISRNEAIIVAAQSSAAAGGAVKK